MEWDWGVWHKLFGMIIALDGPSAAGKGHIGTMLATEFDLYYMQSSVVYRGLAYVCMSENMLADDSVGVVAIAETYAFEKNNHYWCTPMVPNDRHCIYASPSELATERIGEFASRISVLPAVRTLLGQVLRDFVHATPQLVMEGRDIGTAIAPHADLKIFITATPTVRAERRYKQLLSMGQPCTLHDVRVQLNIRDSRDESREASPLKPAHDAMVIDTSHLIPDQVVAIIKAAFIQSKLVSRVGVYAADSEGP